MKIQDRGTMKWVSPMLAGHVGLLQDAWPEYKKRPILNEQKMVEIDSKLKFALEEQVELEMTYYQAGNTFTSSGKLIKIDQWQGFIVLLSEGGGKISLHDIIDVALVS